MKIPRWWKLVKSASVSQQLCWPLVSSVANVLTVYRVNHWETWSLLPSTLWFSSLFLASLYISAFLISRQGETEWYLHVVPQNTGESWSLTHSSFPCKGNSFHLGKSLLALSNTSLGDRMIQAKRSSLPSLSVQSFSSFLFHYVAEVS